MPTSRRRPVTISSRVTTVEKSIVQAAAISGGVPVSEFIHVTVLPDAKRIVGRSLQNLEYDAGLDLVGRGSRTGTSDGVTPPMSDVKT